MANNKIIFGNQVLIDLTADTVTADKLAEGITAHDRSGEVITGTNTYDADTSDANAVASEILVNKTAYAQGTKITGSMPNNGGVSGSISSKDQVVSIPAGYHDGSGGVSLDDVEKAKLVPSNILQGVSLFGVQGEVEPSSDVQIEPSKTVTPYTTAQTILPSSGYDAMAQVVVSAIAYAETPNAYGTTVTIGTIAPS